MKTSLVEFSLENVSPDIKVLIGLKVVGDFSISFFKEDLAPFILESKFEIKIEWYGLVGGLIIESIFIDFDFGLCSFSGDDGGGEELSGFVEMAFGKHVFKNNYYELSYSSILNNMN